MALHAVTVSSGTMPPAVPIDEDLERYLAHVAGMIGAISVQIVAHAGRSPGAPAWRGITLGDAGHASPALPRDVTEIWLLLGAPLRATAWLTIRFADADARRAAEHAAEAAAAVVVQFLATREESGLAASSGRAALVATEYDDCGLIALDHDCRLVFANASAQALLEANDGIQLSRGTVRLTRYAEALRFRTMLDCLVGAPTAAGNQRCGSMMLIPREAGRRPLLAVLAASRDDEREDVGVIIRLVDPDGGSDGLEPICRLLGLSPVEGRVTRHLVNGLALADTAAALRIKPDTARAYLKQIFLKTGTHRQAELVALLARYRRAVAGDVALSVA